VEPSALLAEVDDVEEDEDVLRLLADELPLDEGTREVAERIADEAPADWPIVDAT
jgi:hypothetical protein